MQSYQIAAIPAYGVGPEVTDATIDLLRESNE